MPTNLARHDQSVRPRMGPGCRYSVPLFAPRVRCPATSSGCNHLAPSLEGSVWETAWHRYPSPASCREISAAQSDRQTPAAMFAPESAGIVPKRTRLTHRCRDLAARANDSNERSDEAFASRAYERHRAPTVGSHTHRHMDPAAHHVDAERSTDGPERKML